MRIKQINPRGWYDIPGYDGKYQINYFGNVRRALKRGYKALHPYIKTTNGRRVVKLNCKEQVVMKLMQITFIGELPPKMVTYHKNGIITDDAEHRTVTDTEKQSWDNKSNFSGNYEDLQGKPTIPTVPTNLPNPQSLTITYGGRTHTYDGSEAVAITIETGGIERIEKLSTDTTVTLEPNKLYIFPEMSELTITLAEPSDTGIANEYHFVFQSGATATTLSIPDTIKIPSGFSVDVNKIYEISILEGCLCAQSWAVS